MSVSSVAPAAAAVPPQGHLRPPMDDFFGSEEALREGLQRVLPSALVEATGEARQAVSDLSPGEISPAVAAASLAAALGSTAASAVAAALMGWLGRRSAQPGRWPAWLRPAIKDDVQPVLVTLTEFSQERSRYVRMATDGVPVLLSRHGMVVAAVVPLVRGVYEEAVMSAGLRHVDAADEERRNKVLQDWDNGALAVDAVTDPPAPNAARRAPRKATARSGQRSSSRRRSSAGDASPDPVAEAEHKIAQT